MPSEHHAPTVSSQSNRATETLERLARRPVRLSKLDRGNVDDLLWAIRQINERNAIVAEALAQNDTATISTNDVDALQASHDAVRSVYEWVAGATSVPLDAASRAQSLSAIANKHNVTLRALRHLNPELDHLRSDDPVPEGVELRIPADSTHGGCDVDAPRASRARSAGGASGSRRADVVSTKRGQSFADVADLHGMPIDQLRDENDPALDEYSDEEPLPRGTELRVTKGAARSTTGDGKGKKPSGKSGRASRSHRRDLGSSESEDDSEEDGNMDLDDVVTARGVYRTREGDTLRKIATERFQMTLPQLRVANPELNGISDYQELPLRTNVYRLPPANDKRDREVLAEQRRRQAYQESYSASSRDDYTESDDEAGLVTNGDENLDDIADYLGVSVSVLLRANRRLGRYSRSSRPLPEGIRVELPAARRGRTAAN